MTMPVALIATARLRPQDVDAFAAWHSRHEAKAATYSGFLSSDLIPPAEPGHDEWTLILNFQTAEHLLAWQDSQERSALLDEAVPFFEGGNPGQALVGDTAQDASVTGVTGMFFSRIKPGMEARYRDWAVRIQATQAKFPGYRGMYLQPPGEGSQQTPWTTLVRYDTAAHLEAWMASPERAAMLKEAEAFVDNVESVRLATAFPGWVPVDPASGQTPPNWKTALLILLGIFPFVMLELRYLNPFFSAWHWNASWATFVDNALTVAFSCYIAMPLCVRWFSWWLYPKPDARRTNWVGSCVMTALFAAEVASLWWLLP